MIGDGFLLFGIIGCVVSGLFLCRAVGNLEAKVRRLEHEIFADKQPGPPVD